MDPTGAYRHFDAMWPKIHAFGFCRFGRIDCTITGEVLLEGFRDKVSTCTVPFDPNK